MSGLIEGVYSDDTEAVTEAALSRGCRLMQCPRAALWVVGVRFPIAEGSRDFWVGLGVCSLHRAFMEVEPGMESHQLAASVWVSARRNQPPGMRPRAPGVLVFTQDVTMSVMEERGEDLSL